MDGLDWILLRSLVQLEHLAVLIKKFVVIMSFDLSYTKYSLLLARSTLLYYFVIANVVSKYKGQIIIMI